MFGGTAKIERVGGGAVEKIDRDGGVVGQALDFFRLAEAHVYRVGSELRVLETFRFANRSAEVGGGQGRGS